LLSKKLPVILGEYSGQTEPPIPVETEPLIPVETEPLHMRDMTWLKK
jgi:hypothetical protein